MHSDPIDMRIMRYLNFIFFPQTVFIKEKI
jgi:hypothetical protein